MLLCQEEVDKSKRVLLSFYFSMLELFLDKDNLNFCVE